MLDQSKEEKKVPFGEPSDQCAGDDIYCKCADVYLVLAVLERASEVFVIKYYPHSQTDTSGLFGVNGSNLQTPALNVYVDLKKSFIFAVLKQK